MLMRDWLSFVALLCAALCTQADVSAGASKRVCYAYFSSVTDLGWTYSINLGRAWVDAMIGSTSTYVEDVGFMSLADQKAVFENFVGSGCKVVVIGTLTLQEIAWDYATQHPEVRFICLQCSPKEDLPNYATVDIRIEQAGYIAGRVAALEASVKSIGYVASDYVSPAFRTINSFALGALSVQPNITLKVVHVGSWYSPRKERIAAMRLIEQHGVDLLAYDSDSTTVLQVAKDTKKLSIAAKVDGTASFGESNLLSRVYVWDTPLEETISAALNLRNWTVHRSDNEFVGFEQNAVSLGTFSTSVDVPARISAQELVRRYKTEGDFTFCVGSQGLKAFCPKDANIHSPELGGIPGSIFPCDLPDGVVMPDDGNCLSDQQQLSMTWLVGEFDDLGRLDVPELCPLGTRMDYRGSELCVPCAPGYVSLTIDAEQCEACPPGTFAVNGVECRKCTAGTFSNTSSSVNCTACPVGTYGEADGQMECAPCGAGYFAASLGQVSCEYCPVGSYNDGSADGSCLHCPEGETTEFRAASSLSECICPAGQYRNEAGTCRPCPTGMVCDAGSDVKNLPPSDASSCSQESCPFPRALPKYMTLPMAPLEVYLCRDEEACPGGTEKVVSTCGPHRAVDEVACGLCGDNAFLNADGVCQECSGDADVLLLVAGILGAVLVVGVLAFAVNRDLLLQRHGTASIIILGGVFITSLQTALVFNQLSLDWVEPMLSVMQFASLFSLDLRRLKSECYLPVTPTSRLIGRQIIAPACLPVLIVIVVLKRLKVGNKVKVCCEVGNTAGTLFSVFYISVVTSAVTPFVCYPHPSDSGTGSSMINDPAVLCWHGDDRHPQLVAVAIISFLLVPGSFLAVCIYAVLRYPHVMANRSDYQHQWLHTFRFLFFRFKPEAYAYGVANLLRNLLICMLPAVIPGTAVGIQIFLLFALLLGFAMMQGFLQPWRTKTANIVDGLTSVVLVLVLVTGLIGNDVGASKADLGLLGSLVLTAGVLGLLIGVAIGARNSLFPKQQYFYFLSHHKAAAAAQVRLLQILILKRLHKSCFLDSDNLTDLGLLFETLKTSVAHFVIYLTKETLTRPWCVGEVVIANEARLPVTKIKHPSYLPPREEQLHDIDNYIAKGVKLADFNMDAIRVRGALRWIAFEDLPTISIQQADEHIPGSRIFHEMVTFLGGQTKGSSDRAPMATSASSIARMSSHSDSQQIDTLIISNDPEDLEATAASGIIMQRIQAEATSLLHGEVRVLADHGPNLSDRDILQYVAGARAAVVVLTEHSLHCLQQLQVILAASAGDVGMIAVRTPAFVFPNEAYYGLILPNVLMPITEEVQAMIKAFFGQIALPLSTHASEAILQAECQQIMSRVPLEQAKLHKAVLCLKLPRPSNRTSHSSSRHSKERPSLREDDLSQQTDENSIKGSKELRPSLQVQEWSQKADEKSVMEPFSPSKEGTCTVFAEEQPDEIQEVQDPVFPLSYKWEYTFDL